MKRLLFVAIQQEDWSQSAFTIVTANQDGQISYLNPISNKITSVPLSDFEKIDKEIILLLDAEHTKDEPHYKQNKYKEKHQAVISQIPAYAFIVVSLVTFGSMFYSTGFFHWISPFFLITSTIGVFISLLLVWYEVDVYNPLIKEVCGGQDEK